MEIKNEKHVILENNQQEDSIFHQVDELIGENKLDDALLLLDLIPEGSPNFANALFARSMILAFLDLHDESMETLNDSLTTQFSENQPFDPNDPEDLFDMGITNFYFSEYEKALTCSGWTAFPHFLIEEKGFFPDGSIADRIRREEPDLVFLCNPNNPTGILYPPELLMDILEACQETGARLAVDECFLDFVHPGKASSMVNHIERFPELFILKAFTKNYGMPGVRLGYGISSDPDLLERMRRNTQPWNVSMIAQRAGLAALQDTEHIQKGLDIVEEERRFLSDALAERGFIVCRGEANFILFRTGKNCADLLKKRKTTLFRELLDKRILIRDCSTFAGLREGYYRIAVRTREENRRFTEALEEVISDLKRDPENRG